MKKLFIVAALMIATGVYASPSYAQRVIDANSPEGMRLQNRVLTAEPIHPPQQKQEINIIWPQASSNYDNIYYKILDSKETPYFHVGRIRCRIFLGSGALCTIDSSTLYIFIPAEDIENFENAASGYSIPTTSKILKCNKKLKPGQSHWHDCCTQSLDENGYLHGWNLYRNGWIEQNGIRIPIFSLKDPKAKPTDGSMVVPREELKKRK